MTCARQCKGDDLYQTWRAVNIPVTMLLPAPGRFGVPAEVTDENDVQAMFERAAAEFGDVDFVVHTAGITPLAPIAEMNLADFDRVQRTNVQGTLRDQHTDSPPWQRSCCGRRE